MNVNRCSVEKQIMLTEIKDEDQRTKCSNGSNNINGKEAISEEEMQKENHQLNAATTQKGNNQSQKECSNKSAIYVTDHQLRKI